MRSWTAEDIGAAAVGNSLGGRVALVLLDTDRRTTEISMGGLRPLCFGSDEEAIEAASRNTGTILPYLNSPGNIYGSHLRCSSTSWARTRRLPTFATRIRRAAVQPDGLGTRVGRVHPEGADQVDFSRVCSATCRPRCARIWTRSPSSCSRCPSRSGWRIARARRVGDNSELS